MSNNNNQQQQRLLHQTEVASGTAAEMFRNTTSFFDSATKRNANQDPAAHTHTKRARLDSASSASSTASTASVTANPPSQQLIPSASTQAVPGSSGVGVAAVMASVISTSAVVSAAAASAASLASPANCDPEFILQDGHLSEDESSEEAPGAGAAHSVAHRAAHRVAHSSPAGAQSSTAGPAPAAPAAAPAPQAPAQAPPAHRRVRKFRSRSLPNILLGKSAPGAAAKVHREAQVQLKTGIFAQQQRAQQQQAPAAGPGAPPLPPVNIQSLREIDLTEILKNPQLRHDILFDPQLQFRPNLDGERGRRKKIVYDKYWSEVQAEITSVFVNSEPFNEYTSRIPVLFKTLKDILTSLLPAKDKQLVTEVLDMELIVQQLKTNSLDFMALAKWLADIFKCHCAPMRDLFVDQMMDKFARASSDNSVELLVDGLRMIFTILEAMKLDVANHQIRILRPFLINSAIEFEKDYFKQMVSRCKLDLTDSIAWFRAATNSVATSHSCIDAILSLLSCSNMVSEFPSSLAFDHTRLILLRANVRQIVCLELCLTLYRQLVLANAALSKDHKKALLLPAHVDSIKREIVAIITDDNGNVKWTRNIGSISLQLARRSSQDKIPKEATVEFAFNWLIKQTQPSSQVYSLMEKKIFRQIKSKIVASSACSATASPAAAAGTPPALDRDHDHPEEDEDGIDSISSRVALLSKFHWSVFGGYYS